MNDNNKFWDILARSHSAKNLAAITYCLRPAKPTVEIKIDALPAENTAYWLQRENDFYRNKNIMAGWLTYISNISFVNYRSDFFFCSRMKQWSTYPMLRVQVATDL